MRVREGKPLPEGFNNRPKLSAEQTCLIQDAFWELSTDRNIGFAEGPIPWSTINRFASYHGINGIEFENFLYVIRALDRAYLQHRAEARDKPKNDTGDEP